MSERDDDFLSRWSRRKVEARDGGLNKKTKSPPMPEHKPGRMRTDPPALKEIAQEVEAEAGVTAEPELVREAALQPDQAPVPADDVSDTAPGTEDTATGAESEQKADPEAYENFDFESLNYASDYTQFMKKGVPEAVRRRALRMLWGSNPILANIDGLNDYDEDFTDAALAVKVLSSNYKPGLVHLTEEERNASYSEEARKAGPQPSDEEEQEEGGDDLDVEDSDVEDMEDDDATPGDVRTAATPEGDGGDKETPDSDDVA
jgi:Protein of unknown function (DUF3306)